MLLRLSMMWWRRKGSRPFRRLSSVCGGSPRPGTRRLRLPRVLDVLGQHVRVCREPIGGLGELAALDLPDLNEPAALVIGRGDLQRRNEPTEREAGDLLEAGLDVRPGDLAVRLGLQGIPDRLD